MTLEAKRAMIDWDQTGFSVARPCRLLGLSRSSLYYRGSRDEQLEALENRLLRAIDELYTQRPYLGSLRYEGRAGPGVRA